ncbi:N-6 DNA methylase, partial [Paraburkholderia phymatum]|uniref:N-6 DNA methylase n=1 Tax=Paraburkholderia phymatum TaxID=148447 RepID=UPI00317FE19F
SVMVVRGDPPPARGQPATQRLTEARSHQIADCKSVRRTGSTSYLIIKEFCSPDINLSPKVISNLQMGYLFEELVRKFNEQSNEEARDHFTPREVIRLMVQLVFTGEDGIYEKGIYRSVYDPTAGNSMENFEPVFNKQLENLFVERMDGNEEIFVRLMNDETFRNVVASHLMRAVYRQVKSAGD